MLEAARQYRSLGLSVIPVGQDKKPLIEWKVFQDEPAHTDQIDEWWTTWPTANVGAVTGKVSGLVVLDADGPEGLASLKALGTPATTWLSRTGRVEGGWQQFFRHPGDDVVVGNRAGLRPGLDVRGDGGYVVLPPSLHPSGRRYEWLTSPRAVALAPLSPSLLELLTTPTAPVSTMTTENGIIPQGQRNEALYRTARALLVRGLSVEAATVALLEENRVRCRPPLPDHEVRAIVDHAAEQPHRADFERDRAKRRDGVENEQNGSVREAVIIPAATIAPETIEWLWPGRIATGALTNTVGLPDQGKTLLYCDIAGRLTTGSPMPPAARAREREPQRVLILTLEDSLAATIVPRLIKAGTDLEFVDFVRMVQNADGSTSLLTLAEDLDVLAATLSARRYGLLIVDGIMGYLGRDAKTHNDADVRRVLTPFTALLDRVRVAGLSVMHPPKTITNIAYYAGGSIAFTSVPRVALGVAPDPEDEAENPRRLLLKIKGNLYGAVPTLAYRIKADGPADVPWLEWEPDPVRVNVADVLDPLKETPEDRSIRRSCEEWLRSYLADGPKPSREVEDAARQAGFKPRTIDRAKAKVADSVKQGLGGWYWLLR